MRKAFIISGGDVDVEFLKGELDELYKAGDMIISADAGLNYLSQTDFQPTLILGDFDSVDEHTLQKYRSFSSAAFKQFPARKDFTDTELSLFAATDEGITEIFIYGATGTRIDHVMGVLMSLERFAREGVNIQVRDSHNHISCLLPGKYDLTIDTFGKYMSLVPVSETVTGVTMEGVSYPTTDAVLSRTTTLGISNEITEDKAYLEFKAGVLLLIKSRD